MDYFIGNWLLISGWVKPNYPYSSNRDPYYWAAFVLIGNWL
ncbi:MAG: hypothetical protein P5697_00925 [Limnospira sp. PMC 1256.20]|nr:hypothetical protein [Limnospira sp. PMC 1256.20]MDT9212026.1 hypothetical protein [Limnospira sp. PMC 1256.20]